MNRHALFDDLDVSRETFERLELHVERLKKWNKAINLVSPGSLTDAWARHVLDSAQLIPLLKQDATDWFDLGSGAGFPGIVIAIMAMERMPGLTVTLIESDRRKAVFLREVIRETGCRAIVEAGRVESQTRQADIISARGFARLPIILSMARPILKPAGFLLLHKGAQHEAELTEAREIWHMDVVAHPSRIDPTAAILEIPAFQFKQDTV